MGRMRNSARAAAAPSASRACTSATWAATHARGDVSWIWDVDFETLARAAARIVVCGDRALDLALRLKYAQVDAGRMEVVKGWSAALDRAVQGTPPGQTLFVLATYTAMLELRAVLAHKGSLQPYWVDRSAQPEPETPGGPAGK